MGVRSRSHRIEKMGSIGKTDRPEVTAFVPRTLPGSQAKNRVFARIRLHLGDSAECEIVGCTAKSANMYQSTLLSQFTDTSCTIDVLPFYTRGFRRAESRPWSIEKALAEALALHVRKHRPLCSPRSSVDSPRIHAL